jgi:hypothetical protein
MDILQQYDKENPSLKESSQETYGDSSGDYGQIVSFVMRISQGKIQNEPQANFVLLIIAAIIAGVAIMFFISGMSGGGGKPLPYEQTYKPLQ